MSARPIVLLACLMLLTLSPAGCKSKSAGADGDDGGGSIEASQHAAAEIRQRYQRLNPRNRVGVVIAVKPDADLAAVGDIAVKDFGMGDVVTFITTGEEPFNTGVVVNATPDALHVRYEPGKRAPRVGHLAVRIE